MSFLYIDTLQQATSVSSACVLDPASSLLVPGHDALHTYSLSDLTDPSSLQHSKSYPLHERIECVVGIPLAAGEQQPASRHRFLTILTDATVALHQLPSSDTGSLTTLAACDLKVPAEQDGVPITRRPEGPVCSHALAVQHAAQQAHVMVASMHHGLLHIVKLMHGSDAPGPSHAAAPAFELSNTPVRLLDVGLTGAPPPFHTRSMGPKPLMQQEIHVRALQTMPAPDAAAAASASASGSSSSSSSGSSGRATCMIVLLHQNEGPGPSALNLDCLELDWHQGTLRHGPWSCQNVHPTTSLLLPFSPRQSTSSLAPGMLVFSSRSLQLYSCTAQPTPASLVAALTAAQGDIVGAARSVASSSSVPPVTHTRLLEWALPGVPSCAEWLAPTLLVLGDSMAGLHLVSLGGKQPWMRSIQVHGPLAAPSVLCYLGASRGQAGAQEGAQDGTLFLGSRISNSQALLVPAGTADAATAEAPPESCEPLQWTLANSALIKSLAPVQACVTVPDRQGADDAWMVACCGVAPCGRLASMRLGVALKPFVLDGPEVPAGVRLFPLRASARGSPALHHSHLAFSFDAASCTDVLLLEGDSFTQTSLPGVDSSQPSLLLTSLPGGVLLQVTISSVLCVAASGSSSQWQPQPPAPLSLAAARGSWVAVLACSTLHLLQVDSGSGKLQLHHSRQLSSASQVSMLAMVCLPTSGAAPAERDTHVVVGDWAACSVTLLRVSDMRAAGPGGAAAAALELVLPGETPRSAATLVAPAAPASAGGPGCVPLLLVGTNGGFVFMWELHAPTPGSGAWQVAAARQVRISNVAVELSEVEHGDEGGAERGALGYIYAHSGCDAILRLRPPTLAGGLGPPAAASERVEVCRVHGSGGLRAVCPVHTPSLPDGMAWVDRDGRLQFGELELEEKLRWTTAYIGDTPSHVCYHRASGCLVVLTRDVGGGHWMRLVHAETLRQVLAYRLAEGHYHTALAVEQLPCSSQSLAAAAAAGDAGGPAPPAASEAGQWLDAAPGAAADGRPGPTAAPGKEFIVLASYLLYDTQADPRLQPGLQRHQGLLSFFEIKVQVAGGRAAGDAPAAAAAAPDLRYSLLLHGTCRVPSLCMALCTAWPEKTQGPKPEPKAKAAVAAVAAGAANTEQEAASGSVAQPLLISGGHDAVHAFRVHVDDCNVDGARATQRAARAVKRVEALPFVVPPPPEVGGLKLGLKGAPASGEAEAAEAGEDDDMEAYVSARHEAEEEEGEEGEEGGEDGGGDAGPSAGPSGVSAGPQPRSTKLRAALASVRRQLQRDWNQHVTLTPAARASGLARASVTSLQARGGGVVFASEFLGSVTALRLVSNDVGFGLVPLSADRHAVFAQAVLGLSDSEVLAAAHPCGLLVLRRSPEDEAAVVREKRKQAQAEQEMGLRRGAGREQQGYSGSRAERQGAGAASNSEALQLLGIQAQDCPGMEAVCSARLCHSVYKIVHGRMGLRLTAAEPPAAAGSSTAATPAFADGPARSHALCLGSDGAVLAVVAAQRSSAGAAALMDLQQRIEGLPAAVLAGLTGVQAGGERHAQGWQLVLGSSRDALEDATEAEPLPGAGDEGWVLPACSVDGALIKLVCRQPPESLSALSHHLQMGVPDLTAALSYSESLGFL